jgi:NADPH:quinone reductase-like Zn-dependent oxidoreductase
MAEELDVTFHPRNDAVIVKRTEVGYTGVLRPASSSAEYELYATVLAVGPEVTDLKPGDRIIGLFRGAVPVHTTLPIYAMSEDVIMAKVEGGQGLVAPAAKTESRLVQV